MAETTAKKLKRGQGKTELAGRICGRILPTVAEKESLFYRNDKPAETKTKYNFNFFWPFWAERCIDVFGKLAEFFIKLTELFDVLARKQFRNLTTLISICITSRRERSRVGSVSKWFDIRSSGCVRFTRRFMLGYIYLLWLEILNTIHTVQVYMCKDK